MQFKPLFTVARMYPKIISRIFMNQFFTLGRVSFLRKYFKNIECQVLSSKELCREMNIEHDTSQPKDMINKVIVKLSQMKENIILFVDELRACDSNGQRKPNWSDVKTADNVVWTLSLNPAGFSKETINLRPPVREGVPQKKSRIVGNFPYYYYFPPWN